MARTKIIRRKYTYKSAESKARAQANIKSARSALNLSKKSRAELSEYEQYKKDYYRISKYLRKGKVKVTEIGRTELLTKEEFELNTARGKTAAELAKESYSLLGYKNALSLRDSLQSAGFKLTVEQARARQLSPEMWNEIQNRYDELVAQGLKGRDAADDNAIYFFGS